MAKRKDSERSRTLHIRLTEEEYNSIKEKSEKAHMSISGYARKSSLEQSITVVHDGKLLAEQMGLVYRKMMLYHNDMNTRVQHLQDVMDNTEEMVSKTAHGNGAELLDAFRLQKLHVNAVLQTMLHDYMEREMQAEEELHRLVAATAKGE